MLRRNAIPAAFATSLAAAASLAAGPIPTPIGTGSQFRPKAANEAVLAGRQLGGFRCGRGRRRFGVHLELFARGRVVIVPAGIGVARPFARHGAYVTPRACTYAIRTLEPTGVLEVKAGRALTLGDVFRIWGRRLSPTRLVGFGTPAQAPVRAYVDGRPWHRPLRAIPLRRHAEIVLELGPYIPPHRAFAFRPGL